MTDEQLKNRFLEMWHKITVVQIKLDEIQKTPYLIFNRKLLNDIARDFTALSADFAALHVLLDENIVISQNINGASLKDALLSILFGARHYGSRIIE